MLEKIVRIKSVGRFRDYSAAGDVGLRKLSLIYAENGRGKTTLSAILRSLQTGQKEFITERKTLATAEPPFVHLRLNNTSHQFTNDAWTSTHPDVLVFDAVFVNDNVCSGDYVDHEHKKNLYQVIVGAQGVQLARQIEALNGQIADANADLRVKKDTVSRHLPPGVTLDDYLQWQPVADVEARIRQKTDELDNRQRAAAKSGEIQTKGLFIKVQLPSIPPDFATVLAKQLMEIVADAEARVRQQVTQHRMGRQGETWLSHGLGYVNADRCPFCGQDIRANDLLAAYRSHFSVAYANLKQEVAQLEDQLNSTIGETAVLGVQQTVGTNAALTEFWNQFTSVDLPSLPFQDIQQAYASLRHECLALARRKQQSPTEAVPLSSEYQAAVAQVASLGPAVAAYNAAVDAANARVNAQKDATRTPPDNTAIIADIVQLKSRQNRFEPEVVQACQAYQTAAAAKPPLEQAKSVARQQLDQHCEHLLGTYEQSINEHLDQFNAGFRITNTRHRYTGGTPSSHYQVEINSTALDLGDNRTPSGMPCFRTALSSGDRSALALAFFLSSVKQDPDIARKIVVFDDPFTSLDRFRRTCTQQLIQQLSDRAKQVIVLSHDPFFLKLLSDGCPSAATSVKALQMSKAGDATVIGEWDIEAATQSSYMKDFAQLLGFYRARLGEPRVVARSMRPFLEGMLRSHFPGQFSPNEWLGGFIDKIRAASATDGLHHAKADLGELEAINNYSKKYHHQQNSNADSEPLSEDELHGYVKRTLRLVGGT